MRGFIGGSLIGLVTVAIAIVVLSLLSPASRPPPDVADGAPRAVTGAPVGDDGAGVRVGSDADLAETAPTAPDAQQAQNDTLDPLNGADTRPGDKPRIGGGVTGLADPGGALRAPEVAGIDATAPVVPAPSAVPGQPQTDTQPAALANPAQPDVAPPGSGLGTGPVGDDIAPQISNSTDSNPASAPPDPAAQSAQAGVQPDISTQPAPAPGVQTDSGSGPGSGPGFGPGSGLEAGGALPSQSTTPVMPQIGAAPQSLPQTGPVTGLVTEPDPEQGAPQVANPPAPEAKPAAPQIAALPQAGAGTSDQGPQIGKRVVPLTERNASAQPAAQTAAIAETTTGPAIEVYGVPFENPQNRPMMAIVLIDDDQALGVEALIADFPYPVTFAVDPSSPDAAAKMARHRAAGFEVVALVDLPADATAQDAEINLSVWLDTLPQVVGLLEGPGTGLQGNRDLSDQVTAIAADLGLGLIMQTKGLNTAQKLATRAGVPSALVFRDFDGAGQSPTVMRRFLDQAAFRAGQQGGVIMMGRVRPDTISALVLWGLQDRASRMALAPVSAVLTLQPDQQ